jgi:hypothetical protein
LGQSFLKTGVTLTEVLGGDRSMPPLQVENDMIQDDNKKAELFNDYFCKQADLFYFCSDPRWIIFLYRYVSIWNSFIRCI